MIITICGSGRFIKEIKTWKEKLESKGYSVLTVDNIQKKDLTIETKKSVMKLHISKIKMSDAILVVNEDSYIGNNTWIEIGVAWFLGKDIYVVDDRHLQDELLAIGVKDIITIQSKNL